MAVKLHRCGNMWAKFGRHPCWTVQKALDEMGVGYEVVKESWPSGEGRTAVIEETGQSGLPAIELENDTWCREQSAAMATAIRAGTFGTPTAPAGDAESGDSG